MTTQCAFMYKPTACLLALLWLSAGALFAQPCSPAVGPDLVACGGDVIALSVDLSGGGYGANAQILWTQSPVLGVFSAPTSATTNYTVNQPIPVGATVSITSTISNTDCTPASVSDVLQIAVGETPLATMSSPNATYLTEYPIGSGIGCFFFCSTDPDESFDFVFSGSANAGDMHSIDWESDGTADVTFTGATWPMGYSHVYPTGFYTLTYTITDPGGCESTTEYYVFVGENSGVNPGGGLQQPASSAFCAGQTFDFTITGFEDNPLGTSYIFDIDDDDCTSPIVMFQPPDPIIPYEFCETSCGHTPGIEDNAFIARLRISNPCGNLYPSIEPVYVSESPMAEFTGPSIGCLGATLNFVDASVGSDAPECASAEVVWSVTGGLFDVGTSILGSASGANVLVPGDPNISVEFQQTGEFEVTITAFTTDCGTSTISHTVCIEDEPPAPAFSVVPISGCAPFVPTIVNNGPVSFGCSGAYLWTVAWVSPLCGSVSDYEFIASTTPTSHQPQIQFNNPGTYHLTLRTSNSCGNQDSTVTIVVFGPPTINMTPLPATVCAGVPVDPGATVNGCGSTNLTYAWVYTNAVEAGSSLPDPPPITPDMSGIPILIELTVSNGCPPPVTQSVQELVMPAQVTMVVTADPLEACIGDEVTLTATGGPAGQVYAWTAPGGTAPSPLSNTNVLVIPSVSLADDGLWTLTAGTGACDASGSVEVQVNPSPLVTISPDPAEVCPGGSIVLVADAFGVVGSFLWSNADESGSTNVGPLASTMNYSVTFTETATGCTGTDVIDVIVTAVEEVIAGAPAGPICDQAVGVPLTGGMPVGGTWSVINGGQGTISGLVNEQVYTPLAGVADYMVDLQYDLTANGCPGSDVITLEVIEVPEVVLPTTYPACDCEGTIALTGAVPASGQWTPIPNILDNAGNFNTCESGVGSFNVEYCSYVGTSCEACNTTMVEVSDIPPLAPFDDIAVCGNVEPFALPDPGGGAWNTISNILVNGIFDPANALPITYNACYTITNAVTNCTHTECLDIVVAPSPVADFDASQLVVCQGVPVDFTDLTVASGTITWAWDFDDINSGLNNNSTLQNPEHLFVDAGFHNVHLTVDQGGCTSKDSLLIEVELPPVAGLTLTADTVCNNIGVAFENTSTGTITDYSWTIEPPLDGFPSADPVPTPGPFLSPPCGTVTYHISLTVSNGSCPTTTAYDSVFVWPDPVGFFSMNEDTICSGAEVCVQNTSTCAFNDPTVTWVWNDPDQSTESAPNNPVPVCHTYDYTGWVPLSVDVELTVSNLCGEHTSSLPLVVMPDSIAAFFSMEPGAGCAPLTVNFTQEMLGVTDWTWDFDCPNNELSDALNPSPTFTEPGEHTICLTVSNGCVSDVWSDNVEVYPPANIQIIASEVTICEGNTIQFSNSGSAVSDLQWSYNDPPIPIPGATPSPIFNDAGTFWVFATGLDPITQCPGRDSVEVVVLDAPQASITAAPLAGCAPLEVDFSSTLTDVNDFEWTVYDSGGTITYFTEAFTHQFEVADTFSVVLYATNASGCTDADTVDIEVYPPVNSYFTFTPDSSCTTPIEVAFQNQSTVQGAPAYAWTFGGPPGSVQADPTVTYNEPGVYPVCLTVTSAQNCVDEYCDEVHVYPTPNAAFSVSDTTCVGAGTVFENNSANAVSYLWAFGDGYTSTAMSPNHIYQDTGWFNVSLFVTGIGGCVDQVVVSQAVHVQGAPVAAFTYVPLNTSIPAFHFHDESVDADSLYWDFGDGMWSTQPDPVHILPSQAGAQFMVCLTAFNEVGCFDEVCQWLIVPEGATGNLFVPNAFTPDGTGTNDVFLPVIDGFAECGDYQFYIFNRWGELIWSTDQRGKGWDGVVNGVVSQIDVYIWKIALAGCDRSREEVGHVTVVRSSGGN